MKANLCTFVLVLLLALFALNVWAEEIPIEPSDHHELTQKEARAIERGNTIIAALQSFYAENGYYPEKLGELVPKYIKRIPKSGLTDYFLLFPYTSSFQYRCEPRKYRQGYFELNFLHYKDSQYWIYDSRADSFHKAETIQMGKECKVLDKVEFDDIRRLADAVKAYFAERGAFPQSLKELVPDYLEDSALLNIRYTLPRTDKIFDNRVSYWCQQPLKDDESEMPQWFVLRVRYELDYEYRYASYDNKWEFRLH